jgi:hypothetical protein
VYQREGFKELQAQWNPTWKEAHQLRSSDDPKQLEAFLRLHAGHVGAVGVTHNETATLHQEEESVWETVEGAVFFHTSPVMAMERVGVG